MSQSPRYDDRSIKDRKDLLYDDEELPAASASSGPVIVRKPFRDYLRETPATPMSPGIQALLWTGAAVVALLFAASIWKAQQPKTPKRRPANRTAIERLRPATDGPRVAFQDRGVRM